MLSGNLVSRFLLSPLSFPSFPVATKSTTRDVNREKDSLLPNYVVSVIARKIHYGEHCSLPPLSSCQVVYVKNPSFETEYRPFLNCSFIDGLTDRILKMSSFFIASTWSSSLNSNISPVLVSV